MFSQLCSALPVKDEASRAGEHETTTGQQPSLQELGVAALSCGSFYSVSPSSQTCLFRPLHLCAISTSFLTLFLQFFTGFSISGPALAITLECLFPEPSQSPLAPLSYSMCICQTQQLFSPNPNNPYSSSHTCFGVHPFLAQAVIYRTCWGVARTCLWGRVLDFWRLFWVTGRRWKHLLVLLELSCSGAGCCSQAIGHVFGLGEVESCR